MLGASVNNRAKINGLTKQEDTERMFFYFLPSHIFKPIFVNFTTAHLVFANTQSQRFKKAKEPFFPVLETSNRKRNITFAL